LVAVLGVLYSTGMRRGELERLSLCDWDGEEGTVKVDGQKTGQERVLPVAPLVKQCVESYLPQRVNQLEKTGRQEESALFVDAKGQRLKGTQVGRMLHSLARRAGIPLVTVHQFRHTCASDLLASGVPLPRVKEMLGHATIQTTMRYTHVANPERRKAIEKHPIQEMMATWTEKGGQHNEC